MTMALKQEELEKRLRERGDNYLYQISQITAKTYTEAIISYVLNYEIENNQLINVKMINRKDSGKPKCYIDAHGETNREAKSNRVEEIIVIDMFEKYKNSVHPVFGQIIDYQIPLKGSLHDKAKAIDFINYKNGNLYLTEIKAPGSTESVLKAILEIQTYYQVLDKKTLTDEIKAKREISVDIENIKKCIAVFENTLAAEQLKTNDKIKELIKLFDIEVKILHLENEVSEAK